MNFISFCHRLITISFSLLFFLVPLFFAGNTSELFEFNKMWLTFGLAIVIAVAWITRMILQKQIRIQRTPLDIPILLFLLSQIISTIISLDPYISWWGYYSRFNGGLLSTITYIFLYYAFVTHASVPEVEQKSKKSMDLTERIAVYIVGFVVFIISFFITFAINSQTKEAADMRSFILLLGLLASFLLFYVSIT